MQHPENSEDFAGLTVNSGVSQPPIVNPYLRKRKRQALPSPGDAAAALLLGFVAYGLSIFTYVRAQRDLGAARTSAYYAAAPFLGALLSFLLLGEALSAQYAAAALLMTAGAALVVRDTLCGG